MPVTHCVCRNLSFEELKSLAEREHLNYPRLREFTGCGTSCALCEPYVRLMLKTGRTRFRELTKLDIARILRVGEHEDNLTSDAQPRP